MKIHVAIVAVLEILVWHLLPNYAFTGQCCRATRYRPAFCFLFFLFLLSFIFYPILYILYPISYSLYLTSEPPDTVLLFIFSSFLFFLFLLYLIFDLISNFVHPIALSLFLLSLSNTSEPPNMVIWSDIY